jgi:2-iminoacetate synthase
MNYTPQQYKINDERMKPFIDESEIWENIHGQKPDTLKVREIISKSLNKNRLSIAETATLINVTDKDTIEEIKAAAKQLKESVYGNRIVLFAPLYVGNYCTNDCSYCGFRTSNKKQIRSTLSKDELIREVEILEDTGQKRLILVFGEHPQYDARFIHDAVNTVYGVKKGNGEIRRVNINAAPLDINGFKIVKEAGIGTYQIFQETYHEETYKKVHPTGPKSDFNWRLTALDRAQEAGIDDVGIGALFGVFNWRYELLGLIRHVNHFEAIYNVGPHTISFPRVQQASNIKLSNKYMVSDSDFIKLVAIIRLAVPYTGLILTAREPAHIRDEILQFGVSQIDGGTNIEIKGYAEGNDIQNLHKEQFKINDNRTLNEIIDELVNKGYIPSFCTSCYRTGRTGEHFMEFSVPGFIKNFCQPNALLTLAEYLEDYAPDNTKESGYLLINKELEKFVNNGFQGKIKEKLDLIKGGKRDLYF